MRTLSCSALAAVLLLTACASDGSLARSDKPAPVPLETMLADAERSAAAGHHEQAFAALTNAMAVYPGDKGPWIQMAQLKFDRGSYGEAISLALEALQRAPGDRQGNSIVAVSALRLSTRALADLSQQNNLHGPVRTEAQELARLLRASLGEEVLVPPVARTVIKKTATPVKSGPTVPGKPNPSQSNGADPFGALK
jgi:hypothetical protein